MGECGARVLPDTVQGQADRGAVRRMGSAFAKRLLRTEPTDRLSLFTFHLSRLVHRLRFHVGFLALQFVDSLDGDVHLGFGQ